MNKNVMMIIMLAVGLGAGFFGGMTYQKSKVPSFAAGGTFGGTNSGQVRRGGATGAGGASNNFRATMGTIVSADTNSITVKMADGSSKIVLLTGSTTVGKNTAASNTDLTTGQTVQIFGTTNSDGSVTAQSIQLNPEQRMKAGVTGTPATNQ